MQSDRRLVALTRAGSSAAFSVIVERYQAPLHGYTRRLLGPDEADDALQQTFVNALGALRRDDRPIEVRPWLYRIAHNVAVNALRRSGRHHEQLDEQYDGVAQPPDLLDRKLAVQRVVQGINELPERQRAAIVAHELEGRSYEEIAHSMSATTPVVRQLVHRARTRLRDACGVFVPTWVLRWLVLADLRTAGSERVGEAVAGGATGAGLLKAGTALLASGAIATGAGGLVIEHDRGPGSDRPAAAAARDKALSVPAPRPIPPRPAGTAHESRPDGAITTAPAESGSHSNGVDQVPVRGHRQGERDDPARPEHQGHRDDGDTGEGSRGPGSGGTLEASHDGSDDHGGNGSSGTGSNSSSGDGSSDSSSGSGGTDSHGGSGSSDEPQSPRDL